MKIILAGFNVDYETIKELAEHSKEKVHLTPEIFSAAYARISRSTQSATELRNMAKMEIEKARKSNRNIIFRMGHHSVAEHAVFNFDIMGISRLLAEELEQFRLNSYTEKSQRYIKLTGNYVIPKEIKASKQLDTFKKAIQEGITFYHELYTRIVTSEEKKLKMRPTVEEKMAIRLKANEDARYILSLSQKTQLGITINARNLELLLRRFASHGLAEARIFGRKIHGLVKKIAPSIILFYKENDYDKRTYPELRKFVKQYAAKRTLGSKTDVQLINCTKDADTILIGAILHTSSNMAFGEACTIAKSLNVNKRLEIVKKAFKYIELYDTALREFEYIHMTFELTVSASCFAQLKRHRMATITCQYYDQELGVTIPRSIRDAGMEKAFRAIEKKANDLFFKIKKKHPQASQYVLTNAHRKRVLLSMNARELYHISRLREDENAQWEIRDKTAKMIHLVKNKMPLTLLLIGGKDRYPEIYKHVFGKYPKVKKSILPS
ncbi:MAG: FAD-dependent thymidylate synthase [Candidatus Cloacimonadota bacterium]|nr:MAG: FAD-dependent thymidylate synthase [Candidatus Cloacimonadota bacterium]